MNSARDRTQIGLIFIGGVGIFDCYSTFLYPNQMVKEGDTLPKFNIAPENRPSQKESSLPTILFQGLC